MVNNFPGSNEPPNFISKEAKLGLKPKTFRKVAGCLTDWSIWPPIKPKLWQFDAFEDVSSDHTPIYDFYGIKIGHLHTCVNVQRSIKKQ